MKEMTKRILILVFLVAGTLTSIGCRKTEPPRTIYKGVVIYNICGNIVIQATGAEAIGENNWTDNNNAVKPVLDHVFKVANPCEFGTQSQGDTISFEIVSQRPQNCAQCLIYIETPATAYPIRIVR
jgi:hypothetical protein